MPGKGTVRQSAKAKSVLAMCTTPLLTPAGVSDVAEIKLACVVSIVARSRPGPGSDTVVPLGPTKRSHTGPVIPVAIGTSMPKLLALALAIG